MKNFEAIFNDSYSRVLAVKKNDRNFFDHFYEIFINQSDEIAKKFVNTDMQRQKDMLKTSFFHILNFFVQKTASKYIQDIAQLHHDKIKVTHEEYRIWMDSIIASVNEYDPMFSNDVEVAWRVVMAPGIEFMKYFTHQSK